MTRTKSISARNHRKSLKEARGFKNATRRRIKTAKEALLHQGQYAYIGRKLRKRDLRKLWTIRINAGTRKHNLSYSRFISLMKKANVQLDRKILSHLAIKEPKVFDEVVKFVNKAK